MLINHQDLEKIQKSKDFLLKFREKNRIDFIKTCDRLKRLDAVNQETAIARLPELMRLNILLAITE